MGLLDWLAPVGAFFEKGAEDVFNIHQQQEQLDWQKYAQQQTWNREDNAVQRRVADLKAAGLSPVLAAGSAASSSSPISVTAPQFEGGMIGSAMNAMTQKKQIDQADASIALAQANKSATEASQVATDRQNSINTLADRLQGPDVVGDGKTSLAMAQVQSALADMRRRQAEADAASTQAEAVQRDLKIAKDRGLPMNSTQEAKTYADLGDWIKADLGGAAKSAGVSLILQLLGGAAKVLPSAVIK